MNGAVNMCCYWHELSGGPRLECDAEKACGNPGTNPRGPRLDTADAIRVYLWAGDWGLPRNEIDWVQIDWVHDMWRSWYGMRSVDL